MESASLESVASAAAINSDIKKLGKIPVIRESSPNKKTAKLDSDISFFGEVDRNDKGEITSEYPAWMHEQSISEFEDETNKQERRLRENLIPPEDRPYAEMAYKASKDKLRMLKSSKPKMPAAQKDYLWKQYKEIGEKIGERLYTRSSMAKGTVSPHEEAKRMTEPSIKVDADLAKKCNVRLDGRGRVTRDGASKIWQICGGYLGESRNIEVLRRD